MRSFHARLPGPQDMICDRATAGVVDWRWGFKRLAICLQATPPLLLDLLRHAEITIDGCSNALQAIQPSYDRFHRGRATAAGLM